MVVVVCKQHTEDGEVIMTLLMGGSSRAPVYHDGQMDSMKASSTRLIPAKAKPLRAQMFFQI